MAEKADTPRKPRFLGQEIEFLFECIDRYPIVKSGKTNAITLGEKEIAWKAIAHEYNTRFPNGPRSIKDLQTKYRNEKQSRRKSQTQRGDGNETHPSVSTTLLEPQRESLACSSVDLDPLNVSETNALPLVQPETEADQSVQRLEKKLLEKKMEVLEIKMAILKKELDKFSIQTKKIKDEISENDSE